MPDATARRCPWGEAPRYAWFPLRGSLRASTGGRRPAAESARPRQGGLDAVARVHFPREGSAADALSDPDRRVPSNADHAHDSLPPVRMAVVRTCPEGRARAAGPCRGIWGIVRRGKGGCIGGGHESLAYTATQSEDAAGTSSRCSLHKHLDKPLRCTERVLHSARLPEACRYPEHRHFAGGTPSFRG